MNRRPIIQPLTSLLPTLTGGSDEIPPQLTDLATSLLAQSRYKAPILRPEEEVARMYACAHLACERLKGTLNLPKIEPRPPCAPKIYNKVLTYLTSVLTTSNSASTTPVTATHPRAGSSLFNPPTMDEAGTPAKKPRGRPRKADSSTTALTTQSGWDPTLQPWVMRGIREICGAFGVRPMATNVFAGVQSVVNASREAHSAAAPGSRRTRGHDNDERAKRDIPVFRDDNMPYLMVTIFLLTFPRLTGEICDDGMVGWCKKACDAIRGVDEMSPIMQKIDDTTFWTWTKECIRMAHAGGWLDMEWYHNLRPGSVFVQDETGGGGDDDDDDGDDGQEDSDEATVHGLRPAEIWQARVESGVSSHLAVHQAVIWFSARKKEEYAVWEREIMGRIARIEQTRGTVS